MIIRDVKIICTRQIEVEDAAKEIMEPPKVNCELFMHEIAHTLQIHLRQQIPNGFIAWNEYLNSRTDIRIQGDNIR